MPRLGVRNPNTERQGAVNKALGLVVLWEHGTAVPDAGDLAGWHLEEHQQRVHILNLIQQFSSSISKKRKYALQDTGNKQS